MGFSLQVREEAAHIFPDSNCCRLAELSALLKMRGSILTYGNNNIGLQIIGENATVIRKVYTYIRELFDLEMQLVVLKKRRLSKNNIYMIRIMPGQDVKNMLVKTGFLTLDNRLSSTISHKLCKNLCCIKSYMRGVFLGGGSITDPVRSYHLELNTKDESYAAELLVLLKRVQLYARISARKNEFVVYFKNSEQIGIFMNMIGAHQSLLEYENIRVVKEMKNQVNRSVNCETANINKTIDASMRQIENIRKIEKHSGISSLPDELAELAGLRLEYPEMNLQELGKIMKIPATKSCVNHRMRKLEQLADCMGDTEMNLR